MDKSMILAAAAACALTGFAWLALAMEEHWTQVFSKPPPSPTPQAVLRALGLTGLAASGALCFVADRPSMAILVWILFMAVGSISIALMLTWKPALLRLVFPR
ncbi:DUF3325 domain-containing protein [Oxalobacteraceae bacterium R-40]|uniref:DUF3325 domain-containing protein n=1 Tax=Keguizhuia sedimenti TaxID=3064264 RepID=A0ABU1BTT1_9BURK|nr:DUF3325 domain-containing protein [Oxalobacteraceae bacterium R-40]